MNRGVRHPHAKHWIVVHEAAVGSKLASAGGEADPNDARTAFIFPEVKGTVATTDAAGNRAPDKRKATHRIDGTVASVMGLAMAPTMQTQTIDVTALIGLLLAGVRLVRRVECLSADGSTLGVVFWVGRHEQV